MAIGIRNRYSAIRIRREYVLAPKYMIYNDHDDGDNDDVAGKNDARMSNIMRMSSVNLSGHFLRIVLRGIRIRGRGGASIIYYYTSRIPLVSPVCPIQKAINIRTVHYYNNNNIIIIL